MTPELLPVGKRPRCLSCGKELRPSFRAPEIPPEIGSYYSEAGRKWKLKNRIFRGVYGRYRDNLFCGLNCGYRWAVMTARKGKK